MVDWRRETLWSLRLTEERGKVNLPVLTSPEAIFPSLCYQAYAFHLRLRRVGKISIRHRCNWFPLANIIMLSGEMRDVTISV